MRGEKKILREQEKKKREENWENIVENIESEETKNNERTLRYLLL